MERPRPELRRLLRAVPCLAAPEGLAEALVTGGLPPLDRHPDDVYRKTYERVRAKNEAYYERYPEGPRPCMRDRRAARSRGRLAPERRPTDGWRLPPAGEHAGDRSGAEQLHCILELPVGSPAFLHDVQAPMTFERNPIYAVIHEACYAPGVATRWSAERVFPDDLREDPTFLTGEHIYPWMFEDYGALRPLAEAAEILAEHEWPDLYDPKRLAENEVPAAAAIYAEDMYVERELSEETAARIRGLRPWITNEHAHDGLRSNGEAVLGRLSTGSGTRLSASPSTHAGRGRDPAPEPNLAPIGSLVLERRAGGAREGTGPSNCGTSFGASVASSRSTTCRSRSRKARSRG